MMPRPWLAAAIALSACATTGPLRPAGGLNVLPAGFTVDLPEGWYRTDSRDALVATRDGLQRISVAKVPAEPPDSVLKGRGRALPEERAERAATWYVASASCGEVLEVAPATLAGHQGFRMIGRECSSEGLGYTTVLVDTVIDGDEWVLRYTAPTRHIFQRDLGAFEQVVLGFRVAEHVR